MNDAQMKLIEELVFALRRCVPWVRKGVEAGGPFCPDIAKDALENAEELLARVGDEIGQQPPTG